MKAYLMHADKDFDLYTELPKNAEILSEDLGLEVICTAMANGDNRAHDVAMRALLFGLTSPEAVRYRQQMLSDSLVNADVVRQLYRVAVEAVETERKIWGLSSGSPQLVLYRAVDAITLFVTYLKSLRRIAEVSSGPFSAPGFKRFFEMLLDELDDEYFAQVEAHLARLRFRGGVLISAGLGEGLTSQDYVLRQPLAKGWRQRLLTRTGYSFEVPARDDGGNQVLDGLRARAINLVANAAGQSAEHIRSFFGMVASELAFYVGCLNLHDRLSAKGGSTCLPEPVSLGEEVAFDAGGLYDAGLSVRSDPPVVPNDVQADGKRLVMVTGANQGGKSTFLRSVGLAQMMMQAGMFVAGTRLRAQVCTGVFTHFKREEDVTMTSGKFDEELGRMSKIADNIKQGCLLLCNESFASTNESEGSEIAREVVHAMIDGGVKVVFVTHMFELAEGLLKEGTIPTLFLRAERLADGTRSFRLVEAEPLTTSYGQDSYTRVFGKAS